MAAVVPSGCHSCRLPQESECNLNPVYHPQPSHNQPQCQNVGLLCASITPLLNNQSSEVKVLLLTAHHEQSRPLSHKTHSYVCHTLPLTFTLEQLHNFPATSILTTMHAQAGRLDQQVKRLLLLKPSDDNTYCVDSVMSTLTIYILEENFFSLQTKLKGCLLLPGERLKVFLYLFTCLFGARIFVCVTRIGSGDSRKVDPACMSEGTPTQL